MDDAGLEQLWDELGAIIVDFLGGDEEDPFAHIESTVQRLRAWYLQNAFEDKEIATLINPDGESVVDGALFERMAQAAREVELFPERG